MKNSWQTLMNLLDKSPFRIEKVRIVESDIAIEGDFTPPPLACLSLDDQMFASAFLASHGSIKKMESMFDISYPTVKNRLNSIASLLDVPMVEIKPESEKDFRKEVLDRLDRGEISFEEAIEELV